MPGGVGLLPAVLAVIGACGGIYAGIVHAAKLAANNIVHEYAPTTNQSGVTGLVGRLCQDTVRSYGGVVFQMIAPQQKKHGAKGVFRLKNRMSTNKKAKSAKGPVFLLGESIDRDQKPVISTFFVADTGLTHAAMPPAAGTPGKRPTWNL